jgi:hypothetical protein
MLEISTYQFKHGVLELPLFPVREPHPIVGLPGFQIDHLKWCSMHTLNLGILQFLNGSIIDLLASLRTWN